MRRVMGMAAMLCAVAGCGGSSGSSSEVTEPGPGADTVRVPLTDLGTRTYKGFVGGLYPAGANQPPASHAAPRR